MLLRHSYFGAETGYISIDNVSDYPVAFLVYGKNEARNILSEHAHEDPNTALALCSLRNSNLPEQACKPTVELNGKFVVLLNMMALYAGQFSQRRMAASFVSMTATICSIFTSRIPAVHDALIGYVDDKRRHHIIVFFSKQQGQKLLHSLQAWITTYDHERIKECIDISTLPEHTQRKPITIDGSLAECLNWGYMLKMHFENASLN